MIMAIVINLEKKKSLKKNYSEPHEKKLFWASHEKRLFWASHEKKNYSVRLMKKDYSERLMKKNYSERLLKSMIIPVGPNRLKSHRDNLHKHIFFTFYSNRP